MKRIYIKDVEFNHNQKYVKFIFNDGREVKVPFFQLIACKVFDSRITFKWKTQALTFYTNEEQIDIVILNIKKANIKYGRVS